MKIYVGNLDFNTNNDDLRQAFEAYGRVDEIKIITDRDTGKPRGFAFLEMSSKTEALSAIEGLNGKELKGRTVVVNEARPRSEGPGRGGGRRGGGYGGAGGHRRPR